MAVSIQERPHDFSFSENEIRYVFFVDDSLAPGCAVDIEIRYMSVDLSVDNLLVTVSPVPDATGHIYFHLKDYLKSILVPQMPDPGGVFIQAVTEQVKYFYIRYREVTKALASPEWIDDKPYKKIVLMGGVEQIKFRRNNFFASFIPNYKPFLTWQGLQTPGQTQPPNKMVFVNQDHYLTYLHTTGETTLTMKIDIVFTDGSTVAQSYPIAVGTDFLFRLKAGAQQLHLDLIDQTKKLYYYEISVVNGANVLANPFRFYLDYNYLYHYHDFNFMNSLGGVDGARLKGDDLWVVDTTSDDVERVRDKESYGSPFPVSQYGQANILKRDNYKGDIGWSKTPLQQEVLIELMLSRGIYENIDGRWIGITNLKRSQDLRNASDKKWSFPVEWSYGYADHVFTPKSVILGPGNMNTTQPQSPPPPPPPTSGCIPVGLADGSLLTDAMVGEFYDAYLGFLGTPPLIMSNINKPVWMLIDPPSGNIIHYSGTPQVDGPNVNISFDLTNCSGDVYHFSDTINVLAATTSGSNSPFSVVNSTTKYAMTLAVNNVLYPELAVSSTESMPLDSSITLVSSKDNGVNFSTVFTFDFLTSINGSPVYTVQVTTGQTINIDPLLFPSINYLVMR